MFVSLPACKIVNSTAYVGVVRVTECTDAKNLMRTDSPVRVAGQHLKPSEERPDKALVMRLMR